MHSLVSHPAPMPAASSCGVTAPGRGGSNWEKGKCRKMEVENKEKRNKDRFGGMQTTPIHAGDM
jgi:hypothetical protein